MNRAELIASFANGANKIRDAIKDIPEEAYDFKPSPNVWSIRQIIIHMPDSEASGFVRARKIIAQSGVAVDVYDQDLWADRLPNEHRNIDLSLALFDLMRKATAEMLLHVDEEAWDGNFVMHPEEGKMTLTVWLEDYEHHVTKHVGQIRRTFEVWKEAHGR